MNFGRRLRARAAADQPIRISVGGCGKFATMFLAQFPTTPGIAVVRVVDLDVDRARRNLESGGYDRAAIRAGDLDAAIVDGGILVTDAWPPGSKICGSTASSRRPVIRRLA